MSDVAVHCPHCGEAFPGRDERSAAKSATLEGDRPKPVRDVSSGEAAALLSVAGAGQRRPSFWGDFLKPDVRLPTALFLFDLVLVIATLPLSAGIVATLVVGRSRDRKATYTGSWMEKLVIGGLGGAVILASTLLYDWFSTALAVVLVGWAALAGRAVLRARADRSDDW
jgi:hypothetical protein